MSELLMRVEGDVLIERHRFHLYEIDVTEPPRETDSAETWVKPAPERIYFVSAGEDHYARVAVELWNNAPPSDQNSNWDLTSSFVVECRNSALEVWTLTMGPTEIEVPITPGRYHFLARCQGRSEIQRALIGYDLQQGFPRGIESYLFQLWPAQRSMDSRI